jgi:CRISPR-associated endonuclease Cas1
MAHDQNTSQVEQVFTRDSADDRVWTVHGFGIKITVERGQLIVSDGIGPYRRTRKIPRIDRNLQRIIITGADGYVSLAALKWCQEHGITVTSLNNAGDLVTAWAPELTRTDGRLVRNQALSGIGGPHADIGLSIAKQILIVKIREQAVLVRDVFGKHDESNSINKCAERIDSATSMAKLREIESHAAAWYFGVWTGRVAIPWHRRFIDRVPVNWCNYPGRKSLISGKKTHATDPVNAMLNYCYTLGYAECRTSCIRAGLDPRLGYFHHDDSDRDSLALDVLESMRPTIDRYILGMLGIGGAMRHFEPTEFREAEIGACRLVAPLTHELCERSLSWSQISEPIAASIVRSLVSVPVSSGRDRIRPVALIHGKARFSPNATVRQIIPDKAWRVIKPAIPERAAKFGRTPIDDRTIIAGLTWAIGNGVTLKKVPACLGVDGATLRRRQIEWQNIGVWDEIQAAITESVLS